MSESHAYKVAVPFKNKCHLKKFDFLALVMGSMRQISVKLS